MALRVVGDREWTVDRPPDDSRTDGCGRPLGHPHPCVTEATAAPRGRTVDRASLPPRRNPTIHAGFRGWALLGSNQ